MKKTKTKILVGVSIIILIIIGLATLSGNRSFKEDLKYEINNTVINQTSETYYQDIINVGLNILKIKQQVVIIKVTREEKRYDDLIIRGGIITNGYQYLIQLYNPPKNEIIDIIAHELIHLQQFKSKDLIETKDTIFYKGMYFDKTNLPPYNTRPWEINAFINQKPLQKQIKEIVLEPKSSFNIF